MNRFQFQYGAIKSRKDNKKNILIINTLKFIFLIFLINNVVDAQ